MWTAILTFFSNLFAAIPALIKLFTKSPTEKVDEGRKTIDEKEKDFDETGRPQ